MLYLWLTFGGPMPLRPESYRFEAKVREAATLPVEADVRVAGVSVGKVKRKELDAGGAGHAAWRSRSSPSTRRSTAPRA